MKIDDAKQLQMLTFRHEILTNLQKACWEDNRNITVMIGGNIVGASNIDEQFGYDMRQVIDNTLKRYEEKIENFKSSD